MYGERDESHQDGPRLTRDSDEINDAADLCAEVLPLVAVPSGQVVTCAALDGRRSSMSRAAAGFGEQTMGEGERRV